MDTTPEKHFLLAANALYLGRINYLFNLESLDLETRREKAREDREDYSSFKRLRDCISWDGLLDDRIEPPFQDREARAERDKRLKDLIASPADISRVTFSDIPFSEDEKQRLLGAGLEPFDTLDNLTPISRQGPGPVIWTARDIVIERLTGGVAETPDNRKTGGPRSGGERTAERRAADALCRIEFQMGKRPLKSDVVDVLSDFLGSKKAAMRTWDLAPLTRWSARGAPSKDSRATRDEFRNAFEHEFQN